MSLNEEERAILVMREYEKALSFYSQAEANAQIEMQFGLHYVQKGIFTKEEARFYSQLQSFRGKADYNINWTPSKQDLLPLMPIAKASLTRLDR